MNLQKAILQATNSDTYWRPRKYSYDEKPWDRNPYTCSTSVLYESFYQNTEQGTRWAVDARRDFRETATTTQMTDRTTSDSMKEALR